MNPIDRYLKLAEWLAHRYTYGGRLALAFGDSPSRYTRLENMAARKYLKI